MAISTPQAIVALKSPSYAADPRLNDFVALAELQTGTEYGTCRTLAVALLVCHWFAADAAGGGSATVSGSGIAGAITSKTEGDLSEDYGSGNASEIANRFPSLSATSFGCELIELRKGCLFTPRTRQMVW